MDNEVLEFGSDDDTSPEFIAQLQDIISTGQFPEDETEERASPEEKEKEKNAGKGSASDSRISGPQVFSVFVGNLKPSVSQTDVKNLLETVAEPVQIRVLMQNRDGRKTAVAFVDFKSDKEAKMIVSQLNNKKFQGLPLQVRVANDRKLAPAPINGESVYVRNLAFATTEETLRKLFEPYGAILQIRLPIFEDSGKHRGYGFIDYKEQASVKKALSLNRKEIDGRQILVEPAMKRETPRAESVKNDWSGQHLSFD